MPLAHTHNADIYDASYQGEFSHGYAVFTRTTLNTVHSESGPCAVLDLGCGTGRLAIPLATEGYQVTAVDPCEQMLHELDAKIPADVDVEVICSTAQDFRRGTREPYHLALMLFTVVSYLLTDDELDNAFAAAAESLAQGGSLLVDVPVRGAFSSRASRRPGFLREVSVSPIEGDRYHYAEHCKIGGRSCNEEFEIRFWPVGRVIAAAIAAGFAPDPVILPGFSGTGATYYRFAKA